MTRAASVLAAALVVTAVCGACSTKARGPVNTEIVGENAGLSAVGIADLPTDRSSPVAAVAVDGGLVVYEGPALGVATPGGSAARLWVYSAATGQWSDPAPLPVDAQLTGLSATYVAVVDPSTSQRAVAVVVVGQQCPAAAPSTTLREPTCAEGPSAVVAVTVALSDPTKSRATVGPTTPQSASRTSRADVGWDGSALVIQTTGAVLRFDVAAATFAPAPAGTTVPRTCGRPTESAAGVAAAGAAAGFSVHTEGPLTKVAAAGSPVVVGCAAGTAAVRTTSGVSLVHLADGAHEELSAATAGALGVLPLSGHQAIVIDASNISVVSSDRPPTSLASGAYLPDTLTNDGPDSYVRLSGPRLAFTHVINER